MLNKTNITVLIKKDQSALLAVLGYTLYIALTSYIMIIALSL